MQPQPYSVYGATIAMHEMVVMRACYGLKDRVRYERMAIEHYFGSCPIRDNHLMHSNRRTIDTVRLRLHGKTHEIV